ncbi:MAG: ABC transporter ATP-binding protein [Microbacterium sp.]|uniref:ABC transporter ATP-binding protein n=1 Tax=Microbacterium sp. TaxID=51671 RepID=UPI0027211FFB|nr:ABC transporter ATP-binding protein [Microbacterium sp.]MDO8382270.1 ABC transporter ATP-binding protein [Microbacterium sp.]
MKLELRGITKRFGSLVANDAISITVESGQIHALLGENGAGKSTLMNVLFGFYQPDHGEILLDGVPQHFSGPGQAMAAGIGMVHQHFMLIPVFTVAENIMLGHEPTKAGVIDLPEARRRVREISERFGFDIDPDALVEDLPVGAQQRVEIVKALSRDAKVLVLDEPTAVLTPQETDELMATMRRLAEHGTSIVFITHQLREVKAVADKITVIRLGKVVGEAEPTASTDELAALMVGRDVELTVHKNEPKLGDEVFVVRDLTLFSESGQRQLAEVSFSIREGEVLAIAGVQGNGQTELTETIVGLREKARGSITLYGKELVSADVRHVLESGVGFVPEDRKVDGLVAEFSVAENLMTDRSFSGPFTKGPSIDFAHRDSFAEQAITEFDIRTPNRDTLVGRLSGGNQQKVVLARELGRDLKLLVASQPTRGVDVGSIEFIHERIIEVRDSGVPVLIISTELDEVIALADRIAVMYRGAIIDIVPADTPREQLGRLMAGVTE